MQKISFLKFSPGGNPTILITTPGIPAEKRSALASELLGPLHLQADQVGFVDMSVHPPRLEMMGGELCVNAARCLVFYLAQQKLFFPLLNIDDFFGLVSCSGLAQPAQVRVKEGKLNAPDSGTLDCTIMVPCRKTAQTLVQAADGVHIARLPGITHILLEEKLYPVPENWLAEAKNWREKLGLTTEEACGVVWHAPTLLTSAQTLTQRRPPGLAPGDTVINVGIKPVVHVKAMASSVYESACGSASLAVGLLHARPGKDTFLSVRQPSGETLRLKAVNRPPDELYTIECGGQVRLIAAGEAFVESLDGPRPWAAARPQLASLN